MRKGLFDQLVESVKGMKAIQAGRRKPARVTHAEDLLTAETPDVAALRATFKLSQAKFAALLGISVDTLQNWEQHRRRPEGPAKVLLRVTATHPEALLSVTLVRWPRSREIPSRSAPCPESFRRWLGCTYVICRGHYAMMFERTNANPHGVRDVSRTFAALRVTYAANS